MRRMGGDVASPTALWALVVFVIMIVLGAIEFAGRSSLAPDDRTRYGGPALFVFDVAFPAWVLFLIYQLARFALACAYYLEDAHEVCSSNAHPATGWSKFIVACATVGYPLLLTEAMVVFAWLSGHHPHNPKTVGFFVAAFVFVTLDLLLSATHIEAQHAPLTGAVALAWVGALGLVRSLAVDADRAGVYDAVDWSTTPIEAAIASVAFAALATGVHLLVAGWCRFKNVGIWVALPPPPQQGGELV